MEWLPVERPADAFQRPVTPDEVMRMITRALGHGIDVVRAEEMGVGTYNTVYRLRLSDERDVMLRVAPEARADADTTALRNEWAVAPFLAGLGPLVPRVLAADFSHEIVERDWLVCSFVPGEPAEHRMPGLSPDGRAEYFRRLGRVTRRVHAVRGESFGRVAGPWHERWSDALGARLLDRRAEFVAVGADAADAGRLLDSLDRYREIVDEITRPRLVHGDLWTLNILLDPDSGTPVVTGVLDWDRASWGDGWSDWPLTQVDHLPPQEQAAFWDGYGKSQPDDPGSRIRRAFYVADNVLGARLDIRRRGLDITTIPPQYWSIDAQLAVLDG